MKIERSIDNIELSYDQLLQLVCTAMPHCQKLDDWGILSGGAVNTSYKFRIGSQVFVLHLVSIWLALISFECYIYDALGVKHAFKLLIHLLSVPAS